MAFFGLTTLGPADAFKDMLVHPGELPFHDIPPETYAACFDKYLLGHDSSTALALEVDGDSNILRASLGDMLRELLGRQPRKHELDVWFTWLDFDRSAVMPRQEFEKATNALREFSAAPVEPKSQVSFDTWRAVHMRHLRVDYERQKACRMPLTVSQEIGWHNIKPGPPPHPHHLNATDVTRREGRTAASYYGHFLT